MRGTKSLIRFTDADIDIDIIYCWTFVIVVTRRKFHLSFTFSI